MKHQNLLAKEKSPYLLQHKDNPVSWHPWGKEAFDAAKKENKLIFVSIGYSTCHWCHVMEKDSFEKEEVAEVLNRHFISIKVDREERPDVDQIFMDAVMTINGNGGWPMSVFLTPDLKPFFGGTFFWKDQFIQLLHYIQNLWENQPNKIRESEEQITTLLKSQEEKRTKGELDEKMLKKVFEMYHQSFDEVYGGFGNAPKFPRSTDLSLLLRIHRRSRSEEALKMVTLTLDKMAYGGIYDHLGGGFHRYATDAKWLVPHFEKMLYDNALLIWTYLEAYQVTDKEMYSQVAREILDYVLRDMTDPLGGFYSAEDADSEGEEGKFYVWTEDELKGLLTKEEFDEVKKVYGVSSEGNFEHHTHILNFQPEFAWDIKESPLLQSAHRKLFHYREKRIHPYKDDKIITSWNGLMIAALSKAYQVLGNEVYLVAAQKGAQFVRTNLFKEGKLLRRYREHESRFNAYLEDYAYLINALLYLYESDFNSQWLQWAQDLQQKQDELFWDSKEGGYYFSEPNDEELFMRKKETYDGATPSGNSLSALNLLRLHALTLQETYLLRAESIFSYMATDVNRYPPGHSQLLIALDFYSDRSKEIVVVGPQTTPETKKARDYLYRTFLPNKVVVFGNGATNEEVSPLLQGRSMMDGKITFYICEKNVCHAPTGNWDQAKKMISEFQAYSF